MVAAALVGLLLLGSLGLGAVLVSRAISGGGDRVVQFDRDGREGMGPFGPGGPDREDRPRGGGGDERLGPMGPGLRGLGGLGNVQHGEFSVTGPDGRAVAMLVQRGEVTKASATSVTVRSADDFTATYAVNEDTRLARSSAADLSVGEQVLVLARKDGAVAVAIHSGLRS